MFSQPLSLLTSLILFIGIFKIGELLVKFFDLEKCFHNYINLKYQNGLIGSCFIILLLYPFVYLSSIGILPLKIITLIIIFLGIHKIYTFFPLQDKIFFKKESFYFSYISILLIILFFLISLGPITSADALDYHLGVPLYYLNYSIFPYDGYWFHAKISGAGEIILLLGVLFKAEQIGGLVQFYGILSIIGCFNSLKKIVLKKNFQNIEISKIVFLSSPVIFFLITNSKPQILLIGATTLSFLLIYFNFFVKKYFFKVSLFATFLLTTAFLSKFSFALSIAIIGVVYLYKYHKEKLFLKTIIASLMFVLVFLLPIFYAKFYYIGYDLKYLLHPLPINLPGYQSLYNSISFCGYYCNPITLFIPTKLNEFSQVIGVGFFIFLFIFMNKDKKLLILKLSIFTYILIGFNYGQMSARLFLEPFIWAIFIFIINIEKINPILINLFKFFLLVQAIILIFISSYYVLMVSTGSLSNNLRDNVMLKVANGNGLYEWSNSILSKEDVLISSHRSMALSKTKTISTDFLLYISEPGLIKQYFEEIKEKKPNYFLHYGKKEYEGIFMNCLSDLRNFKKDVGYHTGRNPLNRYPSNKYNGYLYEFNHKKLPSCVK